MKKLKSLLLLAIIPFMAGTVSSCTDYQDEIDALDNRVTRLEDLVKNVNRQLEALQIIADALENADYITNVTENSEGCIITFKKAGAVFIANGIDGIDGVDGLDAEAPDISMKQGPDGYFYWTLNGEFIVTPDGGLIRANGKDGVDGKDGKDGVDGKDGKDGVAIAPMIRINEGTYCWEVSYDGGITWVLTNMYAKGQDGKDGNDAPTPEISVKEGPDGNLYWTINGTFIITSDGKMIRANGKDGKDGQDGKAIAPQVRINPTTLMWEISYDGGNNWMSTGVYAKGKDGTNGTDGKDGTPGNVVIKSVQFLWVNGVYVARFELGTGYFDVPISNS